MSFGIQTFFFSPYVSLPVGTWVSALPVSIDPTPSCVLLFNLAIAHWMLVTFAIFTGWSSSQLKSRKPTFIAFHIFSSHNLLDVYLHFISAHRTQIIVHTPSMELARICRCPVLCGFNHSSSPWGCLLFLALICSPSWPFRTVTRRYSIIRNERVERSGHKRMATRCNIYPETHLLHLKSSPFLL